MLRTTFSLALCVQVFVGVLHGQLDAPPRYVSWGTYLGGTGDDVAFAIDADAEGNVYVAGRTNSFDFLAFAGFDAIVNDGGGDASIVKLSADGSQVLAAAALQSPDYDIASALAVTPDGHVVVVGNVSAGFTPPAVFCRAAVSGGSDVFVALYDSNLEIVAFELLGGTAREIAIDLHVGQDGTITVLGATNSTNGLGATPGAYRESYLGGESDAFVARLRLGSEVPCGERVSYLTYLGSAGTDNTFAHVNDALQVGDDGLVTVAGTTWDPGTFPTTPNAFRAPFRGRNEIFVAQLRCDPGLGDEQLVYAAIVGGSGEEVAKSVDVSADGSIRLMGWTWSGDFPRTEAVSHHGDNDVYVAVLDPSLPPLNQLRFGTLIEGSRYDPPYVGVPLPNGALLIGGLTISTSFPTTPDALGGFSGVNEQACLLEVRTDAGLSAAERVPFSTALTPGTFCSGGDWNNCDRVYGLAMAPDGSILACGPTSGPISAASDDAAQIDPAGGADWFVYRLDLRRPEAKLTLTPESGPAPLQVCADASRSSTPQGTALGTFTWDFGDGTEPATSNDRSTACHRYDASGVFQVGLSVTNDLDLAAAAAGTVAVGCASGDVAPWTAADIGAVQLSGGARRVDGGAAACLAVCAAGRSLTGREDGLHFVHQEVAADGALSAQFGTIEATSSTAAVGLMWRESLDPGARYAAVLVDRGGRLYLRHRPAAGATTVRVSGGTVAFPVDLRLERRGEVFTGFAHAAGDAAAPWTEVGMATLEGFGAGGVAGAPLAGAFATASLSTTAQTFTALTAEICGLELREDNVSPRFRRGDCNDDGTIDISDPVCTLEWLFLGKAQPGCVAATNTNEDEAVDISDPVSLLGFLFLGGLPPIAPFPDCGRSDLEADRDLGCETPQRDCPQ